jgi:hypothetical protein
MKNTTTLRLCISCRKEQILSAFLVDVSQREGRSWTCKICDKSRGSAYTFNKSIKAERVRKKLDTREYRKTHRDQIRIANNLYVKQRHKSNVQFKLANNLRGSLRSAIKRGSKIGSAVGDLGCSIQHLKLHLELFWDEGMSWENYGCQEGQWSIDHIKPLSIFDLSDRAQLLEAVNYRNLQPMWHTANRLKSNKYVVIE